MTHIAEIIATDLSEGELPEYPYGDLLDIVTRAFEALEDHGFILVVNAFPDKT